MKLAVFEGPLDLLLHLIERNELDISAVSLVLVVEQYMQYLELMRTELKLEAAAEFLVVAGKLLLIKSRSLLPRVEPPEVGLEAEEDPAEELARQLEEYRQFKAVAEQLRALKDTRGQTFARAAPLTDMTPSVKLVGLDPDRLVDAFRRAIERVTATSPDPALAPAGPRVTQAERIKRIETGLHAERTLPFDVLLDDCRTVEDVIVTFLAVLELLKQARIRVWQLSNFGAIVLSRVSPAHA
ncbi:MAG: segregation/condensation protein A [Chloroflexi bacterium]|nr:segregation/condensation protein A [Chloroflexota bacterium]